MTIWILVGACSTYNLELDIYCFKIEDFHQLDINI